MLKKLLTGLFGDGSSSKPTSRLQAADPVDYAGYLIISEPDNSGGQYRVSGLIRQRSSDGKVQEHRFERSDMVPGRDACDELMVAKAKRFIDEMGESLFDPDPRDPSPPST